MAAAVVAADVGLTAVPVVVVVAVDSGVKAQRPGQQGVHRLVRAAADAAIQSDARPGRGRDDPHPYAGLKNASGVDFLESPRLKWCLPYLQ